MNSTIPLMQASLDNNKGVHAVKNANAIGIDLTKNAIQVFKIDKHGELTSNKAIMSMSLPGSAR